jgi:murein DD-endopeptidase
MFHNDEIMIKNIQTFFCTLVLLLSWTIVADAQDSADVAPAPEMIVPIDCELGWNCWIANYVDHDTSEDSKDYRCNKQTYNGHKGTDFMIRNYHDMIGGVTVRAAAGGEVLGVRDGMKDIDYRKQRIELVEKKECGNGVRIKHKNGWVTQYCHLRKNSVKVKKGQMVKSGETLGFVGSSGLTQFPQLRFQVEYIAASSKERSGAIVDPFVGVSRNDACEEGENSLWPEQLINTLKYNDVDIIDIGFSPSTPKEDGLVQGLYDDETLSVRSPELFLWARILHVKKGDKVTFTIKDPEDKIILDYTSEIDKDQAYRSLHAGLRKPGINWEEGVYRGFIQLDRAVENGGQIYRSESTVSVR